MQFSAIVGKLAPHAGKVVGASIGLAAGGFWGLLAGAGAGFAYDQWRDFIIDLRNPFAHTPQYTQQPGLDITTTLAFGTIASARVYDLPGLRHEAQSLAALKTHFNADSHTLRYIGKILRAPPALHDAHVPLQQLRQLCSKNPVRVQSVIGCLLDLAQDNTRMIDRVSFEAIHNAAKTLGMDTAGWNALTAAQRVETMQDSPYGILGVTPDAPLPEITRVYRNLIREAHPDRWGNVANSYTQARLQQRAARLNAAYEQITAKAGSHA